jgi:FeS assembly SUF system protein
MLPDESPSFDLDQPPEDVASGPDESLREGVLAALRQVFDPEIPVNLVELGLIYEIDITAGGNVAIEMTLTSPSCPVAEGLPSDVERAARGVEGVNDVTVELVWEPIWSPELMSEEAKLQLGML